MKDNRNEYLKYRIDRSNELYKDALLLWDHNSWRSCVNRLYYSSFHLISALVFMLDMNPKSHEGLKTLFLQHFVKTGLIDIELGKLYALLHDWRQESDYAVFSEFSREDVEPLLTKVLKMNTIILEHINSLSENT